MSAAVFVFYGLGSVIFLILASVALLAYGGSLFAKERDSQDDEYPYDRRHEEDD